MGGRGGWVLDPNTLTLPPQAGPNDPAIIIGPDLPPCMQSDYSAAIFWRPGFTLDPTNTPYLFLAEHVFPGPTGVQIVDEGYLLYDPFTGTCAVNVMRQKVGFYAFGTLQVSEYYGTSGTSGTNRADTPWTNLPALGYTGTELYYGNQTITEWDTGSLLQVGSGVDIDVGSEIQYGAMASGQSVSATSFTSTSTGYTATGGAVVGRAFTMPPSGQVSIHYGCRIRNSGASASTYPTIQIRTGSTIGSGTVVLAADDSQAIDHAGSISDRNGGSYLFSGTSGTAYNVQMVHRVEAGTGTFSERQVYVVPVLC